MSDQSLLFKNSVSSFSFLNFCIFTKIEILVSDIQNLPFAAILLNDIEISGKNFKR